MANNDWRTKRMAAIRKLATEDNSAQKEKERRTYSPENYMDFVRRLVANSTNDPNSAAESAKVQRTIARPRTYTLLAGDKTLSDQRKEELTKEAAMNVRPTARDTAKWAYDVRENGQNDTQANVLGKGTQYMVSDAYLQSNIDAMKNRIASAQQNNADILADDSKMHASELQADKNRAITEYVMDTVQNGKSYDAEAIAGLKAVFGEMSDRDALKMLSQLHSDPEAFLNKQLHSSEETVKFDHNIGLYEDTLGGMETEQANREMVAAARASEDWDSASQYAMRTGKNYQYARSLGNVGLADDLDFDVKYDFINNPDYFDAAEGYNPLEYESYLMEWRTQGLDMLTPDEVDEFNYFSSQSDEAGQRYLDSKSSELTRRAAEASREYMNYLADEYPISTYLMAAATNVANAFTYPAQVIDALDGSVDNTGAFGQFTQGIRQRQGENAAEALDWEVPLTGQPLGGLLYNTSTGYVDFALAALTGSGLGGANAAAATQAIMGSQVASATLQSDLDAGVSPVGAVAHSVLAAGIEALTEKYSIEAFLADPVTTMRHVAKNFFTEASEEGASNLLNIVGDEFIQKLTGNESEIMRQYNELIVSGMSEQEAANSVLQDFVQNLSGDMLVGGLVGAMAGGTSAFAYNAKGSQLKKSGTGEQLMQIAEQMPEDSKSKRLANKITKTKSNFATAQLYNTLAEELPGAQDVLDNITAAGLANQLREEGEEGDTQAVAKSIVKLLRGNQLTAEEYSALAQSKHGMSVLDATVKINQRDSGEMQAYDTAYKAGFYGQQATEGMNTEYYQAGVEAAQKAEQARLNRVGKAGLKGGGVTYVGAASTRADVYGGKAQALNTEALAPQQRVAVQALEGLAKVSGMNFVLYEGQADANGNITIENGSYDGKTNTIYLDLNAGKNRADQGVVNYAILRTAAHEMTHFIESNSKDGYAALKKFVVNELTARGQNFDALVENKLRNAQRQGIELTRGGAVAEVIADACEMALKDTQAIRRLAKQDKSLYGRIKSFLRDLMGKIRKALEGVKATHPEARALMEAEKYIDGLQKLWDDALVEAVETARSVEETDVENRSETVQVLSEAVDETGQPMLSLRSMEEDYDTYRSMLKTAGATDADINALFDTIDAVMDAVRANRAKLDFGENIGREDRAFLPIKPNSDPLYKVSLDFSSLCRKRLLQQAVQERLETKYNTVLTKAERVAVRQALLEVQKEGLQIEVACALCYVEAARLKSPAQIARFMDNKRANLVDFFSKESKAYGKEIDAKVAQMTEQLGYEPNTPMSQMKKADKKKIQDAKKAMYPAYKPTAEEEAIIRTAESLPESMYKTEKGLWQLKREHPEIFAAYTTFVRNATKSKGIEGDTPFYAGDTATISDGLIKAMNEENGTRSQSWSDFQVIHILDYMAAIIEFSTRNAKMQSYTKVPDFVKLMGNTGMMINLSLIPNDFNGELTFDPVEGMAYETAQLLRDTYHGTVGNISIGISNDHIRALLADAGIDYVIPYHKSSMDKKTRDAIGLKKWEDYENTQNEKERAYPETNTNSDKYHKKPRFSEWYNHAEAVAIAKAAQANAPSGDKTHGARMAMREMADRYKQLCHERGLQEKFAQFAEEENYWKLLIDRKMIDQVTGDLIEQKAVKPVFNKADILDILSDEVARFDKVNADFEEAAARIDKMWAAGDIRKAAKSKTIIDQVAAFEDAVVVRNIAASAEGVQMSGGIEEVTSQQSLRETSLSDWTDQYLERVRPSDIVDAAEADNLRIYQKRLAEYRKAKDAYDRQVALLDSGKLKGDELIRQRNRVNMSKGIVDRLEASVKEARNAKAMQSLTEKAETFVRHNLVGKDANQLKQIILNKENEVRQLKVRIDKGEVELKAQREKAMRDLRQLRSSAAQDMVNMQKVSELSYAAGAKVRHIQKGVKALHNLRVNETDYKNIPEHLKAFVGDVVKIFGDSYGSMVWSSQKASQISELYAKLKSPDGPYAEISPFYDPDMEETLHELSEWAKTYEKLATKNWYEAYKNLVPAQDQNTDSPRLMRAQLRYLMDEAVADLVDHVNAIVRNSRNLFNAGRKQQFAQIGTAVKDELLEREDKTVLLGKPGTVAKWIDNAIRTGNITPVYFFEQLGNHELSALFNDFRQGQEEYAFTLDAVQDKIRNLKEQYDYNAWKDAEELAFQTSQGHNITLTKEQALWLYATWKREQANDIAATEHLTKGGFVYEGNADPNGKKGLLQKGRSNTTGHLISEKDMAVVDNYLTAEEKAYADAMVELLSKDMAALGNRVSMEMFGIRKYKEKYYFPYKTVGDQLIQTSLTGATNTTDDSRLKHGGFTHRLTSKARTALVMGNFSDVVANHVSQMVTYSSFVLPIENMNRVLNYRFETDDGSQSTIRSLIRQKYGENALKYIETFLHDMNGGIRSDTRSGVGALVSLHKKAAVVASLSVALQQPSSILRAAALMNPKYLLKGTVTKADYEELKEHSGVAIIKQMGRFDTNVGRSNVEWLLEDDYSKLPVWKKMQQALNPKDWESFKYRWNVLATGLPTIMDEISWGKLWNAVKAEQADLHPDMDHSSDEFLDMCGERFNDIVDHTQVYDSLLAKSQLMRSKSDIDKMVTSFAAEPTLTLNMLYDAFTNKNHSERSKRIWGTVFSITASSLAAAIGSALISAWNKDDDKRTAQEKLLNKTVSAFIDNMNPLNNLPYIRDLYSLFQGYEVERADMSVFSDIVSAVQKVKSDSYTGFRKVEELAGSIANLFGVPVKNVMRDLRRVYNAATSDWTDPTQTGIETAWVDAVDEAFPFVDWYKTGVNDYYERDLNAMLEGDKAMASDISRYLREVRGKEDKDIMSGVKSAAKDRVKNGSLDSDDAIEALTKAYPDDVDADTLYWDYEKLKTGSTTKYEAFYTAIESGKDLKNEIQRYLDNGVSKETLAGMISKKYQTTLAELYKTNKTKAADLQAKLLAAYVLLGYDREKKLKDIKKWYE